MKRKSPNQSKAPRSSKQPVSMAPLQPQAMDPGPRPDRPVERKFKCVDKVHLEGGLGRTAPRTIQINGAAAIPLDRRQFLVLFVLVCHNLRSVDANVLDQRLQTRLNGSEYLAAKDFIDPIQAYLNRMPSRPEIFARLVSERITTVIGQVRDLLKESKLNPYLIDNGPNGMGYRLETAPANVRLTIRDSADGLQAGVIGEQG